ncbi:MAG: hypothetical protein J5851_10430 [Oscillospiraceae bacterium]|nr:hypothetical protein [Oscillospiraceae bacterium]
MKHECPHCHEKTFTPLQKALCGSMRGRGKPCPNCGRRCVNGMSSIYFSSATTGIALAVSIFAYLAMESKLTSSIIIAASIAGSLLINFLFDMFFGKLAEPIRTMQ